MMDLLLFLLQRERNLILVSFYVFLELNLLIDGVAHVSLTTKKDLKQKDLSIQTFYRFQKRDEKRKRKFLQISNFLHFFRIRIIKEKISRR